MKKEIEILAKNLNCNDREVSVVISHGDADGIVSASIISKALELIGRAHIVLISLNPTTEMTDKMMEEAKLYTGEAKLNYLILDRNICTLPCDSQVIWCDHHKTNIDSFMEKFGESLSVNTLAYLTRTPSESGATVSFMAAKDIVGTTNASIDLFKTSFDNLEEWVKITALWDTFTWKKGPVNGVTELDIEKAVTLSKASYVLPAKMLFNSVKEMRFTDYYDNLKFAASIYQFNLDEAIEEAKAKSKEIILCSKSGVKVKALITRDIEPTYVSLFADNIFENNKDIECVVAVSKGLLSTRVSQTSKMDASSLMIMVGKLCGFSGGGHIKAAGCKYKEIKEVTVDETTDEDLQFVIDTLSMSYTGLNL